MTWTVILENENRKMVEILSDELELELLDQLVNDHNIKLIKYLDPYGDTIYNCVQMHDLIEDLKYIKQKYPSNKLIDEILKLAQLCLDKSHHYLIFYGD